MRFLRPQTSHAHPTERIFSAPEQKTPDWREKKEWCITEVRGEGRTDGVIRFSDLKADRLMPPIILVGTCPHQIEVMYI